MTIAIIDYSTAADPLAAMKAAAAARRARLYGEPRPFVCAVEPEPSAIVAEFEEAVKASFSSSWTEEEDAELRRGAALKETALEISQRIPRTYKAVSARARKLGLYVSNPRPPKVVKPKEEELRDAVELYRLAVDTTNSANGKARQIMKATSEAAGLTMNDLMADCRNENVIHARHKAMWLIARETSLSYQSIGRLFGGRDHTTVLNAIRRHNGRTGENVRGAGQR